MASLRIPFDSIAFNSDDLLKLVVESSADLAIFTIDDSGNVTSWNLGAERLLDFGHQEIMGHNGDVIFTAEDRAAGRPKQSVQKHEPAGEPNGSSGIGRRG
jgi:PAS domain S-box-containing protein